MTTRGVYANAPRVPRSERSHVAGLEVRVRADFEPLDPIDWPSVQSERLWIEQRGGVRIQPVPHWFTWLELEQLAAVSLAHAIASKFRDAASSSSADYRALELAWIIERLHRPRADYPRERSRVRARKPGDWTSATLDLEDSRFRDAWEIQPFERAGDYVRETSFVISPWIAGERMYAWRLVDLAGCVLRFLERHHARTPLEQHRPGARLAEGLLLAWPHNLIGQTVAPDEMLRLALAVASGRPIAPVDDSD